MDTIKIISFDVDGTLVTMDFGDSIWHTGIPDIYAESHGIDPDRARDILMNEYLAIGEMRKEWYDIKYWFRRFQLGDYRQVLENHSHRIAIYPEVPEVLKSLSSRYILVVSSNSAREFLEYTLNGLDGYFKRVFSSVSDYGQIKIPEFYLQVCQELNVAPQEMVHVGDRWEFDFLAAREAGVGAFHIDREQKLENANSLASLKELEGRLESRY